MFCTHCGQLLSTGARFCPRCGMPVAPETDAAASADAPTELLPEEEYTPEAAQESYPQEQDLQTYDPNAWQQASYGQTAQQTYEQASDEQDLQTYDPNAYQQASYGQAAQQAQSGRTTSRRTGSGNSSSGGQKKNDDNSDLTGRIALIAACVAVLAVAAFVAMSLAGSSLKKKPAESESVPAVAASDITAVPSQGVTLPPTPEPTSTPTVSAAPTPEAAQGTETEQEETVTPTPTPEVTETPSDDPLTDPDAYILPDSASRKLTDSDLAGLSKYELDLARNEIFARHGRRFKNKDYQAYFDSKNWYSGTIAPDDFDSSVLSSIESANASFIKKYTSEHF